MEKIYEILNRNKGKEISLSANYIEVTGKMVSIDRGFLRLELGKKGKRFQEIKVDTVYSIIEEND